MKHLSDDILPFIKSNKTGIESEELYKHFTIPKDSLLATLLDLMETNKVKKIDERLFCTVHLDSILENILTHLKKTHLEQPYQRGVDPFYVIKGAGYDFSRKFVPVLGKWLVDQGFISRISDRWVLEPFPFQINAKQQSLLDKIDSLLTEDTIKPFTYFEIAKKLNIPIHAVKNILMIGFQTKQFVFFEKSQIYSSKSLDKLLHLLISTFMDNPFVFNDFKTLTSLKREDAKKILYYMLENEYVYYNHDEKVYSLNQTANIR